MQSAHTAVTTSSAPSLPLSSSADAAVQPSRELQVLHQLSDCPNAQLRACLAPLIKRKLSAADIRKLYAAQCFKPGSDFARQAIECLPLDAGTNESNGKQLSFTYVCHDDVCPSYFYAELLYADVDEKECCALGGEAARIWRGPYYGCYPAELAASWGGYLVTPDGKWRHVVPSNCPERKKQVIVAEWPCEPPEKTRPALGVMRAPLPEDTTYAPDAQIFSEASCGPPFNPAVAQREVAKVDRLVRQCLKDESSTPTALRIRFAQIGVVAESDPSPPHTLTHAQQDCLNRAFSTVKIAPFGAKFGEVLHTL